VLRGQVTKIFVTKEIEITHEDRVDQFEMHRHRSNDEEDGAHSPQGSEVGLGGGADMERVMSKKGAYYEDSFVRDLVDPFRAATAKEEGEETTATVKVHVHSKSQADVAVGRKISLFPKFSKQDMN